jgi:hypothetical protein
MEGNMIALIASTAIFIAYIVMIVANFGITRSISASYFLFKDKRFFVYPQIAFSVLLVVAAPTALIGMAAVAICFSALAGNTRLDETIEKIHVIGATGGILLAMAQLILWGQWFLAVPFFLLSLLGMKIPIAKHTFYIEVLAYILVVIGILLYL